MRTIFKKKIILFNIRKWNKKDRFFELRFYFKCYTFPVDKEEFRELNCIKTWKEMSNKKNKLNKIYLQQKCLWRHQRIKIKVQKCTLFVKQNLKAMDKQSIQKVDTWIRMDIHSVTAEYIRISRCIMSIAQNITEKPVMLSNGQKCQHKYEKLIKLLKCNYYTICF